MSTRVETGGPATSVASSPTAARVTPAPSRPFKQVMEAGASAVVGGAEAAVRRLPGGPILAAAFRPGPNAAGAHSAASPEGSAGTAGGGVGGVEGSSAGGMDDMLERNADMNLYYLQLQERISAESRAYTTLSNVLKTRHDTVKNAIGNIR
ncbi:MAG: hypothetical protein HS104_01510 [Polyangiaceae bacterium]|nr:hypothetical protein [Polyangiaceae bacterium]MBK8996783.1 hypothetical protein [Myxococcales bacterium]MCL4754600.1 hypothetical protein [Myxococcales bacterium]